jgi:hypothetical protein
MVGPSREDVRRKESLPNNAIKSPWIGKDQGQGQDQDHDHNHNQDQGQGGFDACRQDF